MKVFEATLFACVSFLFLQTTNAQSCSLNGLCVGSSLGTVEDIEKADCVQLCKDTLGCEWYTYDSSRSFCFLYETCVAVDDSCNSCTTGEDACPLLNCRLPGECLGFLLGEINTPRDEGACSEECQGDDLCNYYTYFDDSGKCVLYNTCQVDQSFCSDCYTSEKACDGDGGDSSGGDTLLVVVKNWNGVNEMSVINLDDPDVTCETLDTGPLRTLISAQSIHATFVGGELMVCGDRAFDCYVYDDEERQWLNGVNRVQARFLPYGLDAPAGGLHWALAGDDGGDTRTSEVFDGESWRPSVLMPRDTHSQCATFVDDSTILIVGGYGMDSAVFTVDLETANTISQPSLPVSFSGDLIEPFCATATKSDGTVVVVVAGGSPENGSSGVDESYIFDVAQAFWKPGPTLPETRTWGRAVQIDNTFLLVGGASSFVSSVEPREDILRYDPDLEEWETLEQRLDNPTYAVAALIAPKDFNVDCS